MLSIHQYEHRLSVSTPIPEPSLHDPGTGYATAGPQCTLHVRGSIADSDADLDKKGWG